MDKTEKLLRMMEHPEQYTEEQIQQLLDDEECRDLYETMRLAASAFEAEDARQRIADGIKDAEWQRFEARQLSSHTEEKPRIRPAVFKIAATFVGIVMLSGITFAAVNIMRHGNTDGNPVEKDVKSTVQETRVSSPAQQTDSIPQTRIFENVPLDEIVNELAIYYNKVATVENPQAHELRLYYKWKPQTTLESVVEDLNHFDRVYLAVEDEKLIVKP